MKVKVELTVEIKEWAKFKEFVESFTEGEETPQEYIKSFFACADQQMESQYLNWTGELIAINAHLKN